MNLLSSSFRLIQVEGHPPLDSFRTDLFTSWWTATRRHPTLGSDQRWLRLGDHVVSGAPLTPWVSNSETEPWDLPAEVPGLFLDELEALVEDEEGTDLQHLSWANEWDGA